MHPGEMDPSSDDCSDVEQAVPTECVDRHSYSGLSDSDDDVTSQAYQSRCVFFTDIDLDLTRLLCDSCIHGQVAS